MNTNREKEIDVTTMTNLKSKRIYHNIKCVHLILSFRKMNEIFEKIANI